MARKSEVYPSKYFKAADHPDDWTLIVKVEMCRREEFPDNRGGKTDKLVAYFYKIKSGLVIGPTIWDEVAAFNGSDDYEDWKGDTWELYRTWTHFAGRKTQCIRVRKPEAEAEPKPKAKAKAKSKAPFDDAIDEMKF